MPPGEPEQPRGDTEFAVTRALFDSRSEDEAIEQVLQAVGHNQGWTVGGFWQIDDQREGLIITHVWHERREETERAAALMRGYRFERGAGLPGRVWQRQAPAWIDDIGSDSNFPRRDLAAAYGLNAGVAFPAYVGPDLVGVMEFFSAAAIRPSESLERTLAGVGSQLGQFLRRARAEQQLRENEVRFRALTETAADSIVTIDAGSTIRYANPATETLFGYRANELVGKPLTKLMPERMRKSHEIGLARYIRTGKRNIPWSGVQLPALHRDGHEFPVEIAFGEFVLNNKRAFTGIMRDVSERVRQQQALEQATVELEVTIEELRVRTEEAEAAARAKSEFLAAMSHELRTPLQAVIGYAGLLDADVHGKLNPGQAGAMERIRTSAQHLLGLIEQVLDISRAETGRLRLRREPVDLCALATETAELLRPHAQEKGLDIVIRACSEEWVRNVEADPGRVRQILLNLLSNAIKFTAQGKVETWFEYADGRALVHVDDTGTGIAPDQMGKLFEPFYQADAGRTRSSGMGLGLAISRDLAVGMGGGLEVSSQLGKGSRFTLWLPVNPQGVEEKGSGTN